MPSSSADWDLILILLIQMTNTVDSVNIILNLLNEMTNTVDSVNIIHHPLQ